MKDLKNTTGEIQELKGYPLDLLVKLLPSEVTQFAALLGVSEENPNQDEWIISYIKSVPINTPEHTPMLA